VAEPEAEEHHVVERIRPPREEVGLDVAGRGVACRGEPD
jgi:hypothetical protein